jgi:hypothetical protein
MRMNYRVEKGCLHLESTEEGGPTLSSPFFSVSAVKHPIIEFRMRVKLEQSDSNQNLIGQIAFITNNDTNFSYSKLKEFDVDVGGEFNTYTFDMSDMATWRGTIRQLRFSPIWPVDAKIEIDYIRFLSESE